MDAFCVVKERKINMGAIETAKSIQNLLQEYGVDNDSLNAFIKDASELPSSDVLDGFNDRVETYQKANTYDTVVQAGDELLNFYNSHTEELSYKANEMSELEKTLEDYKEIHDLYEKLDALIENGEI